LSSYVYMIEPTGRYPSPETKITTAKRQSLADFAYYAICQGQREIGPIGYSPLPVNLVEAAFGQIQKLKLADPGIDLNGLDIGTCDNPTFVAGHPNTNYLATIAPLPPACDKVGAGPCSAAVAPNGPGSTTTPGGGTTPSTGPSSGKASTGKKGPKGKVRTGPSSGNGASTADGAGGGSNITADPEIISAALPGYSGSDLAAELAPVAAVLLLLAFVLPAVLARRLNRKRRQAEP
jgi:hypothetical protein